jgi:wyosine [tRNA(Phe)-imidazoG37] synthetase (radical SAM superfamily)
MCPQSYHLGHYEDKSIKTHEFENQKKGCISKPTLKRLFDSLSEMNAITDSFAMQWNGESMMHPDFTKLYKCIFQRNCREYFFRQIIIDTNASFFNPKFNKRFVAITEKYQQTLILTLSLDSVNAQTFQKIKRAGIKNIPNNCKDLMLKRTKKGNITIIIQALVLEENQKELFDFYRYWSEFFNKHNMKYNVIYSPGQRGPAIKNYILFRKVSPDLIGDRLWEQFQPIKNKIDEMENEFKCKRGLL